MIISASYRTDIPAFHGAWFLARLNAGFCTVKNPYGGKDYTVSLAEDDVDGIVFWTKNPRPFLDGFEQLSAGGRSFAVQFTINGYPRELEVNVPDWERSAALLKYLSNRYGGQVCVWRYDPIIDTSLTGLVWHRENFAKIAAKLKGATNEVVVSFAHIYRKSRRNLDRAASQGFTWRDPEIDEKRQVVTDLAEIAAENGMRLSICSQPDITVNGILKAQCVDAGRLSEIAGKPLKTRLKGNRPGCACSESRDIGRYDSCAMECVYCYAVSDHGRAARELHYNDTETFRNRNDC
jgi:DNA repair photolyase